MSDQFGNFLLGVCPEFLEVLPDGKPRHVSQAHTLGGSKILNNSADCGQTRLGTTRNHGNVGEHQTVREVQVQQRSEVSPHSLIAASPGLLNSPIDQLLHAIEDDKSETPGSEIDRECSLVGVFATSHNLRLVPSVGSRLDAVIRPVAG